MSPDDRVDAGMTGSFLVDDFEDGDLESRVPSGWWYAINDNTSQQFLDSEVESAHTRSAWALHTVGDGFRDWGAFVGVNLSGNIGYLDVSGSSSIRFWVRSALPRSVVLRLLQQDNATFQAIVDLPSDWSQLTVPFQSFASEVAEGQQLDPSIIQHIQWYFGTEAFDVWFDDVEFVE